MAKIKLNGDTSGYIEISAPAVSGNNTLELGPGTKILTNLDNTFTGVSTFTSGLHVTGGSFGLGTDNPDATLKVNVASGNNGVVVQNTSTANIALFGARNGDATVQIGQWGSTASGSTFGLSNADLSFIYTTSYSTTHPSALALGTVSNKPIVFATNNTERLRIDSDGKVGINTVSPRAVLDIEGNAENFTLFLHSNDANANLQFSDNTGGARILNYGGDLAFRTGTNAHSFGAGDSEALRITSDNKLGINITNPTRQLEIYNSSHATAALQSDTQSSLFFSDPSDTNIGQISYMHSSNYMYFRVNDAERLRITSDGQVQVSNTASGNDAAVNIYKQTGDNSDKAILRVGYNSAAAFEIYRIRNNGDIFTGPNQSGADLIFQNVPTGGSTTERLRINSAGQMILGTATNLGSVPPKFTIVNNTNSSTFSECQLLRLNGPSGVGERGGIGFHYAQSLDYGEKPSSFIGVETVAAGGAQQTDLIFATRPNTNDVEPTERMRITSGGLVTKPNQPRFFAWGNSSVNMSTTGYHTWSTFSLTRFNIGNHFSTSTKIFTAPVSGTYLFGCNCRIDQGDGGYFRIILSINNSTADNDQGHSIRKADAASGNYHSQEITALYQLNANDNVRVLVNSYSDSSWQMQSESQFWGYLVA